jgi:flagellar biosynthesis GTPase FlhF
MILKNIFGKTIEAAKKTALQMYGDDFLILESSEGDGAEKQAKITIFKDNAKAGINTKSRIVATPQKQEESDEGVQFVRSQSAGGSRLDSLRKYAASQMMTERDPSPVGVLEKLSENEGNFVPSETEKTAGTMYDRRVVARPLRKKIRTPERANDLISNKENDQQEESKFITHFKRSQIEQEVSESGTIPTRSATPREEQREIKALHKRFDKLEALLDSALMSANLDYASHPAFQQLVQTGINTSTVAGWFSDIIKEGIDPFEHNDVFMTRLGGIIRDSLGESPSEEAQKFMLFAGPSGSGKTNLIMKLCLHHELFEDKNIAVVSVQPQNNVQPYYSILEPFCADNDLPFYKVKNGKEVTQLMEEWESFDHILIDTPSLGLESDHSFREFWKIRQILTPLAPLEVHYVVNASSNRFYFRNSTAVHHPMQPDYVAITHLDEVSQWGPVIPFLKNMGCSARYMSMGQLPAQVSEFNPQWFAQKVIQDR